MDDILLANAVDDIYLKDGDIAVEIDGNGYYKRNAVRDVTRLWRTKHIPYSYDKSITAKVKRVIEEAINEFHNHTCLKFIPYNSSSGTKDHFLGFFKGRGCWSFVGKRRQKGVQLISIGDFCDTKGIVMHEILHALGFYHEQSRPDRDKFVEILWENIRAGRESNFFRRTRAEITGLGQSYDYHSIMHYGATAFTKNRKITIKPLNADIKALGQRNGFSLIDRLQVLKLYSCEDKNPGWSSWTEYGPCTDECEKTRQRFCFHKDPKKACQGNINGTHSQTETVNCTKKECVRDGHWSRWSPWSACTTTCLSGTHTRKRSCTAPSPRLGGKDCKGIKNQTQQCYRGPCIKSPLDCTFEDGTCHWTNVDKKIKWDRNSFITPSFNTGPTGDHTYRGEGHYMYLEATSKKQGDTAILQSAKLPPAPKICISFWYSMYGRNMGTLLLRLDSHVIWSKYGEQKPREWKHALVQISTPKQFKLSFVAVRGPGFRSDIAIDDIFLRRGRCKTKGTSGKPTPGTDVWTCNFDKSGCGILGLGWQRVVSDKRFPKLRDHTTGKGHFFVLRSSRGYLTTPPLALRGYIGCMEFFFATTPSTIITILVRDRHGVERAYAMCVKEMTQNGWSQGLVDLNIKWSKHTTIRFRIFGHVALDDISIYNARCPRPSRLSTPSILGCNFKADFCRWTPGEQEIIGWKRKQSASTKDFYVEAVISGDAAGSGSLRSASVQSFFPFCLTFRRKLGGKNFLDLRIVAVFNSGSEKILSSHFRKISHSWIAVHTTLPAKGTFQVKIVARKNTGTDVHIIMGAFKVKAGTC